MQFNFKKKFGQNFLNSDVIKSKIVSTLDFNENDLVIEIGPGIGALTKIIEFKNPNLLCYEIDMETKPYLDKIINEKGNVIFDDFLNRNVIDDIKNIEYDNLYIIGNLPYYITTPIILKVIEDNIPLKEMTIMIQKEVADRFSAKPGSREYGSITVLLNYFFDIERKFVVNRNYFTPSPNVDSEVIKLIKKENNDEIDFNKFNKLIKDSFHMKRKNIRNNLKEYDLEKIDSILKNFGYTIQDRAEQLPLEVFIEITKNI